MSNSSSDGRYEKWQQPEGAAATLTATAYDGVVQHDGDMQQNSCRVEPNGFLVELGGRGVKSCARVRRIIYEVPKNLRSLSQGRCPDIWLKHGLRGEDI